MAFNINSNQSNVSRHLLRNIIKANECSSEYKPNYDQQIITLTYNVNSTEIKEYYVVSTKKALLFFKCLESIKTDPISLLSYELDEMKL